ncbi:MCE family protein [Mycobacterium deserti]|uniref:MCE family protein n=1 Tax=Mycobacterium deserti TaxID=2978347 RepID=A0ABT2MEH7_9MYCO|nr:MCE family protein [Mycobacterium deserti]MCT7660683.1 MCE family protein [Mycobacterium deserti]
MRSFSERNPVAIGAIGLGLTLGIAVISLNYDRLPFVDDTTEYTAYFAEAGGLIPGAPVQVSGLEVGKVDSLSLDGPKVLVTFNIQQDVGLGDRSEAAIKTKTVLGAKVLELTPRGDGHLTGPIPLDRTQSAYQLPDALGDLTMTISGLNTEEISQALSVLSETFKDTPPALKVALEGVTRFSDTLNRRDENLRTLLANANKATAVLAERSDQVAGLIANANAVLAQLLQQSAALDEVSNNVSALAQQVKAFIDDNRDTVNPAFDKLNGVLTTVDNRKQQVQESITKINSYLMSLGEAVSGGPFFKAYIANIAPGQWLQPFVDAAFSDLGLDPNVLLPSERTDPQIGQPATPALPVPYPRTGQGGTPNLTLPDAITGNPNDRQCGPPGIPLPGPGCYPYREPLPAPPPGGPPPGPPAPSPPELQAPPTPAPSPVFHSPPATPTPPEGTEP